MSINPKYLIALGLVAGFAIYLNLSNPYKKFSRQKFWETATLVDVAEIPQEAIEAGNKNGPVLMWAATTTTNPDIITALIDRGADIHEVDGIFKGTPITAAATYNSNPDILTKLVKHGADINQRVWFNNTPLTLAAAHNQNKGIITRLVRLGADVDAQDSDGYNAWDYAVEFENEVAMQELDKFYE